MSAHPLQQRPVHVAGIGLHRYQSRSDRSYAELGVAAVRQALDDQSALIGQLDSRNKAQEIGVGGDRAIDAAVRMARTGASSDQLAASSGLSRQEARLLTRLHGPDRARA